MNSAISSSSSKIGNLKRFKNGSHNLQGKSSKLKVKAISHDFVAEAMTTFVDRIDSEGLISEENNFQGVSPGCASPKFVMVVRDYFVEFNIDVEAFLKTQVSGLKADRNISKIGLDCSQRIEAKGYAGGLCVIWINTFQIQIILNDPQFTLLFEETRGSRSFLVTFVYGYPDKQKCKTLWDRLDHIAQSIS
ncbi:hypothetical protein PVK06_005451 [Gossypium arboreum]|uniref:Uncharacterized protein n=1 Tax=Gossypium arboreum TaxID=29729 RepID=A0ABR0QUM6_GOSAR|nr:hypothetical protein PVK06_005451 [Gossypium arboreum]